jgi:lysozyme
MIIDLSDHNGTVDFHQLTGVEEVIIRATIGYGTVDKSLRQNAINADAAGFPVSYYHFAYPHTTTDIQTDAINQANFFINTIKDLPKFTNLAIDLEEYDDKKTPQSDSRLSPVEYALWLQSFLDTAENQTGVKCMIYSYRDYLDRHLPDGHTFGNYPLWIANYSNVATPGLPKGWDSYHYWQYNENGHLAGTNNDVDLSKKNPNI